METKRWQDWVTLVLGAWLFFAPFWMAAYASTANLAAWNSYIMGALVFAFSWGALANRKIWEEWVNLAIGVWVLIAPFVLAFSGTQPGAMWNHVVIGVLVALDALSVIGRSSSRMHVHT
jgi:hypothetical protein